MTKYLWELGRSHFRRNTMSDIVNQVTAATDAQAVVAKVADAVAPVATQVAQVAETVAASPVVEQVKAAVAPVVAEVKADVAPAVAAVQTAVAEVKAQSFISKLIAKFLSIFAIFK